MHILTSIVTTQKDAPRYLRSARSSAEPSLFFHYCSLQTALKGGLRKIQEEGTRSQSDSSPCVMEWWQTHLLIPKLYCHSHLSFSPSFSWFLSLLHDWILSRLSCSWKIMLWKSAHGMRENGERWNWNERWINKFWKAFSPPLIEIILFYPCGWLIILVKVSCAKNNFVI